MNGRIPKDGSAAVDAQPDLPDGRNAGGDQIDCNEQHEADGDQPKHQKYPVHRRLESTLSAFHIMPPDILKSLQEQNKKTL